MTEKATEKVVQEWGISLRETLHSMIGRDPKVTIGEACEILITAGGADEIEWWLHSFADPPGAEFWVGARVQSWEALEWAASPATCQDILTKSLAALGKGGELRKAEAAGCRALATLHLELGADSPPIELMAGAGDALLEQESGAIEESSGRGAGDGLAALRLPMRVVLGRASLTFGEICKLTSGSIIELDRKVNDPVEIVVKDGLVLARGQVVVSDGRYGAKVTSLEADRGAVADGQ